MTILKLLANNGFISYNKIIARHIGVHESIVLGELCSIANIFNYNEFYFSLEKMSYDTALSDKQLRKALNTLESLGFLTIEKKGIPYKNWYTLNIDIILDFFNKYESEDEPKGKTSSAKSAELDRQKVSNLVSKNGVTRKAKRDVLLNNNTRKNTDNNINNNIGTSKKFQKPTLEEVKEYIHKNNYSVDAERFIDYYENKEPKKSLIDREPKNDMEKVEKQYLINYSHLYEKKLVKTPTPIVNWGQTRKLLKTNIDKYGVDVILDAIQKSMTNSFVIQKGYSLAMILSTGVLSELINGNNWQKKQNAMQMQDHPEDLGEILF